MELARPRRHAKADRDTPQPKAKADRRVDRELLLEIGCEELPAAWLPPLTNQIGKTVEDLVRTCLKKGS